PEFLIASQGRTLFMSKDSGSSWQQWCRLPVSYFSLLCVTSRWGSRLTRKEIYHIIRVNEDYMACFGFGKIYLIEKETAKIEEIGIVKGSRPLKVCSDGQRIYYGIYTGNEERDPIHLYSYDLENEEWSVVNSFENIRHIHGVFWDKYESKLWVSTGDLDHE